MVSCKEKNSELKMIRGKQIEIGPDLKADANFLKEIQPYHDSLQTKINEILCYNPRVLSRQEAFLESSLGNFYADACFQAADSIFYKEKKEHIDFALFNYGGIRTAIPEGDVKVEDIFKLMPFENKLVVVELSGSMVEDLFNYLLKRKQAHPISGMRISLDNDKIAAINIQGKNFDPEKNYRVLTHDYLQHGGDNMSFFTKPLSLYVTEYKVRDALIDNLRQLDTLKSSLDNRFIQIN
ncbi:5'-nucleotidase [Lutimonas halocynthiae]|uniref:5'-nucleotidase C-terminal domain-containing protein n=1 Tax=Lutimonas halocynthiae TaxID=1446477 RepID=UPI0025B28C46|nr:5'-nucleotidase [Lutimonas halocynthiae]MDN3644365.1 5'-nucleotidase [Lutimonas halocynthiae]